MHCMLQLITKKKETCWDVLACTKNNLWKDMQEMNNNKAFSKKTKSGKGVMREEDFTIHTNVSISYYIHIYFTVYKEKIILTPRVFKEYHLLQPDSTQRAV